MSDLALVALVGVIVVGVVAVVAIFYNRRFSGEVGSNRFKVKLNQPK